MIITAVLSLAMLSPAGLPALESELVGNFSSPVFVTHAGDERLFVVERAGRIKVVDGPVFLNIVAQVSTTFEGGLLGLAFHPDFPADPRFYVHYTGSNGGGLTSIISEFQLDSDDPTIADPATERFILRVDQPASNHNAGWIGFSPVDEYLYIPFGDGGFSGNGQERSQDITGQLLGKLLRVGIDGDDFPADADRNFTIPADNPFVGTTGDDEIWALGLRNPFRCAFDRATGDLYIGDVGSGSWEEVDVQLAADTGGANYGWGCMEGLHCAGSFCVCNSPSLSLPVHEYSHSQGCSITGGSVYRGCAIPELDGRYFFADYCTNRIWSFLHVDGAATDIIQHTAELSGPVSISSIGEDANGELYVTSLSGGLYQIVPVIAPPDKNGNGIPDSCEGNPADLDGDGSVGFSDLILLLAAWGPCGTPCPADLDGSGTVGFTDLVSLLAVWG